MKNIESTLNQKKLMFTIESLKSFGIAFEVEKNIVSARLHKRSDLSWGFSRFTPEERLDYLKNTVFKIISTCKKDEKITLVSIGSGRLLMEYLLFYALRQNGFTHVQLRLIDPSYEDKDVRTYVLPEFKQEIAKILGIAKEQLAEDTVRYFTATEKYLQKKDNQDQLLSEKDFQAATFTLVINPPCTSTNFLGDLSNTVGRGRMQSKIDIQTNFIEVSPKREVMHDFGDLFKRNKIAVDIVAYKVGLRLLLNGDIHLVSSGDGKDIANFKEYLSKHFDPSIYEELTTREGKAGYLYKLLGQKYTLVPMQEIYTSAEDISNGMTSTGKTPNDFIGLIPAEDMNKNVFRLVSEPFYQSIPLSEKRSVLTK